MSDGEGSDFNYAPAPTPLPDGVQKEALVNGKDSWRHPKAGDELTVHYVGTLTDGTQFDSSRDRGAPIKFTIGRGEVIKGWDLGIATMNKGETAKFTIQPEYAYGEAGSPPTIPPSAVLIFEVELISWDARDDVFGDEGVIKTTKQEGKDSWTHPSKGSEVRLSLTAKAEDGSVVEERSEIDYVLGSGDFGAELERVVEKVMLEMSKEEVVELRVSEDYLWKGKGYGVVMIDLTLHEIYTTSDVSMLKDGTVMKKTLTETESHEKPEDGCHVDVRVHSVVDGAGEPVAGFTGPKELRFFCCEGTVCDAIEGATRDMKKGETALVTCTAAWKVREPKLGLSEVTAPKTVMKLELLGFTKSKDMWARTDEDKIELALIRKDVATDLFKAKKFEMALDKYKKVIDTIGSHDHFHEDLKKPCAELKRTIELNKAAVYLQLNDPTNALASCNKVLREDRNNVKALFRRAKSHFQRTENTEALADLDRLLELDPSNAEGKAMIPHIKRAQKVADKASKNTFAKMCEGFGKIDFELKPKPEEPKEDKPEQPKQNPETVMVAFKIEHKPEGEEVVHVVGATDELGNWDTSKSLALTKLPLKWEPPTGSGKAPPEHHFWEATVELPQSCGRFEYQYVIKGPSGERQETGDKHKCDLTGMGGSRVRCTDSWRRSAF